MSPCELSDVSEAMNSPGVTRLQLNLRHMYFGIWFFADGLDLKEALMKPDGQLKDFEDIEDIYAVILEILAHPRRGPAAHVPRDEAPKHDGAEPV
mgnify:CR=1 FL=1